MPEPDPRIINFDGRPLIKCGNLRVNFRQAQALRTMGKEAFRFFAPQTIGICNGNAWAYDWDLSPMKRDMILAIWDFIMDFADGLDAAQIAYYAAGAPGAAVAQIREVHPK